MTGLLIIDRGTKKYDINFIHQGVNIKDADPSALYEECDWWTVKLVDLSNVNHRSVTTQVIKIPVKRLNRITYMLDDDSPIIKAANKWLARKVLDYVHHVGIYFDSLTARDESPEFTNVLKSRLKRAGIVTTHDFITDTSIELGSTGSKSGLRHIVDNALGVTVASLHAQDDTLEDLTIKTIKSGKKVQVPLCNWTQVGNELHAVVKGKVVAKLGVDSKHKGVKFYITHRAPNFILPVR